MCLSHMKGGERVDNLFHKMRLKAGMKQEDVANELGVNQSTVSLWESGENYPRAILLPKIANLYNCTVDDLLFPKIDK